MKNEKVCFNKQTGVIALVGILLIVAVFAAQKLTTTQTSTSSRASGIGLPAWLNSALKITNVTLNMSTSKNKNTNLYIYDTAIADGKNPCYKDLQGLYYDSFEALKFGLKCKGKTIYLWQDVVADDISAGEIAGLFMNYVGPNSKVVHSVKINYKQLKSVTFGYDSNNKAIKYDYIAFSIKWYIQSK